MEAGVEVLKALLPKLAKMLTDEYKLHKGAKAEIRYIRDELESMQAALVKVSNVPPDQLEDQVKLWVRKVRGMSYNIEDTIDSYMVLVGTAGESESSTTCCVRARSMQPRTYMARRNIATEIKRIKKEVREMSERRKRYKVDSINPPAPSDPRLLALYEDEAKLVGIDHSREEIIRLLSVEGEGALEQNLKLLSIVGPGGMGKTTLANAVYQKLEEKFDCTAFVSVSLQPDLKNILSSILRQVTTSKIKDDPDDEHEDSLRRRGSQKHFANTETWPEMEIINKIRLVLEKRRYLIIIDDIWDEGPWKRIECALFGNKLGSKVITTTRNIDVARSCCSSSKVDGIVHELHPLSAGDSEQLLYSKIFGNNGCPAELRDVSRKILEKCRGWPLAIVAIASLLAKKPTQTKDLWYTVYKSINSTGLESNHGVKDMWFILDLSYRDMPSQLRPCLLYLSIFPEDHIIGRDDLIRRWIAEGLVHGRHDCNLYELGDKYFNELISRSMIQPSDVDAFGRAQACKIHDLVLEYITSLSAQEDFITILNGQQSFPAQADSIHRISLRNSEGENGIPQATKRLPHVRTLAVSSRAIDSMPSLSIFPRLRVLELQQCTSHKIRGVENLVHLRYLRLSQEYHYYYDVYIELPNEIGKLHSLQTLDLKEAKMKKLPSTVVQFTQLRVLEISLHKFDKRCENHLLLCLHNVKRLEDLCIIAPELSLEFMLQANWAPIHLRKFTASARERTEHILRRGSVWAELSPFSTLPRWINSSLSLLSDLSIMVRTLRQEDLRILANLSILRSVELEVVEATEKRLEINSSVGSTGYAPGFQYLGNLKYASRAVGLVFRQGAMQKLEKLYLCFDVAETKDVHGDFDLGLENLTSLKTANVEIDCRCARLSEVKAAEASLRNAANLNPKGPTLDVKRYFTVEMLGPGKEIPEDLQLQATKTEDALLSRVGPYGGNGGRSRNLRVAPHRLENVTIRFGDAIDSLAFSYIDQNGKQHSAGPWGGRTGEVSMIRLRPSEHIIEVSGTVGSCHAVHKLVTSLTFVTNVDSYGPFGKGAGHPFIVRVENNSSIVGFFGRAGMCLDAIGFYVRPL